ncbi:MAG: HAMP domain-containing sensor histidine kinase [Leptolyngbyaceae cyanobacterium MO_188.B28]|nr:HAMP domain-containing sensor histidine kinase [Leptolyngbyaceae cyanobacterium MO_188.B28]
MTLLRQFTGWVIASNKIPSQIFKDIHWRLLLAYLIAMAAILGVSSAALYGFLYRSFSHQLNHQLRTLAQAAVPSLDTVKTEGRRSLDEDLPWRDLFLYKEQSLEWFDDDRNLLARQGSDFPDIPLSKSLPSTDPNPGLPEIQYRGQLRVMTIAVYADDLDGKTLQLEGYLRASQSTQRMNATLNHLRLGLGLGGVTALCLASISSLYLTRQAVKPMQQSFQRLTQFAADASHELRNPLTRISIATEIMMGHPDQLKPSDIKKLTTITHATEQMKRLIDDVLFLTRTDAAYVPMARKESADISLHEMLLNLAERFESQAQVKGINFQKRLLINLSVKGNANQLERLFSNLLENAIKYTRKGGRVTLSLNKYRQNAIVSIRDTGIGIPSEYLPFVFRRFWRVEQSKAQDGNGFGLGLAIAETIAKQHRGEILVNSQEGIGTCFQVKLPLT